MNIVFDLGGVVFRWQPEALIASVFEDRCTRGLVRKEIVEHPDWVELDRGTMSLEDAIRRGLMRIGLSHQDGEARTSDIRIPAGRVPARADRHHFHRRSARESRCRGITGHTDNQVCRRGSMRASAVRSPVLVSEGLSESAPGSREYGLPVDYSGYDLGERASVFLALLQIKLLAISQLIDAFFQLPELDLDGVRVIQHLLNGLRPVGSVH